MMRGLAYLLWTSAVLAAICVRIDAKNTKKGKKKSNRPRNKEARASVSAEPDSNVPNVSLTSEEMCDACRVTVIILKSWWCVDRLLDFFGRATSTFGYPMLEFES